MQTGKAAPDDLALAEALAAQGYGDVLILSVDTASHVLTAKRRELLDVIEQGAVESIRGLARTVDRDPSRVQKDLTALYEADIIDFEEEAGRKIPVLRHDLVVIEPVIQDLAGDRRSER